MEYIPSAMKCSDQSKSSLLIVSKIFEIADFDPKLSCNVLIINKLIGIDGLDPKLQIWEIWSRN